MDALSFAHYLWERKDSASLVGPGPNAFSAGNVAVDEDGLHLSIREEGGAWQCAEAILAAPLGFGSYRFSVATSLAELDTPVVFGAFLYENDTQEIDIEVSRKMVGDGLGQFVIQPGDIRGNRVTFRLSNEHPFTGAIAWEPGCVRFTAREGDEEAVWTYPAPGIVRADTARFICNLWLYKGAKPCKPQHVTISQFSFESSITNTR